VRLLSGFALNVWLAGGITGLQEDQPNAKGPELVIYFQYSKHVLILQVVAVLTSGEVPNWQREEPGFCAHTVSLLKRSQYK
jgi:hypothetical protein